MIDSSGIWQNSVQEFINDAELNPDIAIYSPTISKVLATRYTYNSEQNIVSMLKMSVGFFKLLYVPRLVS